VENQGVLDVPGGTLEYQWIPGDLNRAMTLVLLHEGLGCMAMWKSFPEALNRHTGCNVFVYSRFGYGGSSRGVLPRAVQYMHDEAGVLGTVLEQLPGESFVLVGHSDGASIATIYAGNAPSACLHGLVLIAPHFFVEEMTVRSIEKIKTYFESTELEQRMQKYHGNHAGDVFRGWNDIWLEPEFRQWNICEFLESVDIPVLVMQGLDDEYGSAAQVDTVVELVKRPVTTRYYENCGHAPHARYEQEISREIARFIADSSH
jgi:pimeloyl-ACP methyl ester carboxylesterase